MRKIVMTLVASVALLLGGLSVVSPAQAATPTEVSLLSAPSTTLETCGTFAFCLSQTFGGSYVVAFSGATPRNTCENGFGPAGTLFATEGTGVQWWLFRTGSCGGSHLVVHASTNLTLPVGWAGSIVAVMRTSTVGKA